MVPVSPRPCRRSSSTGRDYLGAAYKSHTANDLVLCATIAGEQQSPMLVTQRCSDIIIYYRADLAPPPFPSTRHIKLLDSPGIVFDDADTEAVLLRNCVNVDALADPIPAVQAMLRRCSPDDLMMIYALPRWDLR
jgi:hypothetical protein